MLTNYNAPYQCGGGRSQLDKRDFGLRSIVKARVI